MKGKRIFVILFVVFVLPCIVLSSAFAQGSDAGGGVIAPPSGGAESIAIPQPESVEAVPLPPQNAGTLQTATGIEQQQPSSAQPLLTGSTPTMEEQPLAPMPEGSVPGIPPVNGTGESPAAAAPQPLSPPLPSLEQQPPPELPQAGQQPSAELPAAPLAPVTTETTAPPAEAAPPEMTAQPFTGGQMPPVQQETLPQAAPETLQPGTEQMQTIPPAAPPAPQETPSVTSMPEQNVPAPAAQAPAPAETERVAKPPHIVPGEVMRGMPEYVNVRTTHVVRPGEDLHWLAAVYYGDARLWDKIYEANKKVIKDPNHLVVGTRLVIPPK